MKKLRKNKRLDYNQILALYLRLEEPYIIQTYNINTKSIKKYNSCREIIILTASGKREISRNWYISKFGELVYNIKSNLSFNLHEYKNGSSKVQGVYLK